jgi:hypothetical protein
MINEKKIIQVPILIPTKSKNYHNNTNLFKFMTSIPHQQIFNIYEIKKIKKFVHVDNNIFIFRDNHHFINHIFNI